jgi:hypothetical protein
MPNMKKLSSISPPLTTPSPSHDATFMQLYCACLSGVASQLEQHFSNEGLQAQDIYSGDLRKRELYAVKRAYRMASLATQELSTFSAFSDKA